MDKAHEVLKEVFGYDTFRPGQEKIIQAILNGRDVLGIMPTGAGKSLCYEVPALIFPGITLVVSPLISLMNDQVENLKKAGAAAAFINSSLTREELAREWKAIKAGKVKILYLSPERLQTKTFRALSENIRISFICIDEAHCISSWGPEFRPAYLKIADFIKEMPVRPALAAFTASADTEIKSDIIRLLDLKNLYSVTTGFDRKNLYYEVQKVQDKMTVLTGLLKKYRGECGIIYCLTRKTAEALSKRISAEGFRAACYHAGLTASERQKNQADWLQDRCSLMVATNAFGMGIDKPDVRFVIHYNMPPDMESYYQEAGRAGRDGLPSDCILLYNYRDTVICRFFMNHAGEDSLRKIQKMKLRKMQAYVSGTYCLRAFMLEYFGEHAPHFCGKCSVCLSSDYTGIGRRKSSLLPGIESEELYLELRALRLRLAKEKGILPYRIFSDRTLHDFARSRPLSYAALILTENAGIIRCIKFGAEFLPEIRAFTDTH